MTIQESINRTYNLVATSIVVLAGCAFFPSAFIETEHDFKIDEAGLLLLAIGAIAWYKRGKNRFSRTVIPVIFAFAALLLKIAAIAIEMKDKEDVGDDFGGTVLFILGSLFILWLYNNTKMLLRQNKE